MLNLELIALTAGWLAAPEFNFRPRVYSAPNKRRGELRRCMHKILDNLCNIWQNGITSCFTLERVFEKFQRVFVAGTWDKRKKKRLNAMFATYYLSHDRNKQLGQWDRRDGSGGGYLAAKASLPVISERWRVSLRARTRTLRGPRISKRFMPQFEVTIQGVWRVERWMAPIR